MQVVFFPHNWQENPYLELLEAGLKEFGVGVHHPQVEKPFRSWMKQSRDEVSVLHFHWLHYLYQRSSYKDSLTSILRLAMQLSYAKLLGYRVVWTMHNLYPHERLHPSLDELARRIILFYADSVIVHCKAAKDLLVRTFGRSHNIFVAPHGNYIGIYPDTITQIEARKRLCIPDDKTIFLFQGAIRAYKGLKYLCTSFGSLPNPNFRLLIAGKPRNNFIDNEDPLSQIIAADQRIVAHLKWVPNHDLQIYFRAADVVVCPFQKILTSGSVMLALSFGRPLIAPALGCLSELITPSTGVLYDPSEPSGLREALEKCTTIDLNQMGQNAQKVAESYSWRNAAKETYAAYTC